MFILTSLVGTGSIQTAPRHFFIDIDLNKFGRFTSLNHTIYVATYTTPVDVDHPAHAGGTTTCTHDVPPNLTLISTLAHFTFTSLSKRSGNYKNFLCHVYVFFESL